MRNFARTWAEDLKDRIRVNVLSPGASTATEHAVASAERPRRVAEITPLIPLVAGHARRRSGRQPPFSHRMTALHTGRELAVDGGLAQI